MICCDLFLVTCFLFEFFSMQKATMTAVEEEEEGCDEEALVDNSCGDG